MSTQLGCNEYAQIIQHAPDAVLFSDREGIIRLWNDGAEHIFGFSAAEAVGQSLDLIIPERLRQRHWDGYYRVMESGESTYGKYDLLTVPAQGKNDAQLSCAFSMIIVRDEEGEILGAASILRDNTQAWQKEKELKRRIAELETEQSEK